MNWLGGQKHGPARRSGVVTILDVGSSKVCCMIARLKPVGEGQLLRGRTHQAQVIGIGHQKSRGVKSGVVIDLDKAEQAIRLAVDAAERMAGLTVDSLIVNVAAGLDAGVVVRGPWRLVVADDPGAVDRDPVAPADVAYQGGRARVHGLGELGGVGGEAVVLDADAVDVGLVGVLGAKAREAAVDRHRFASPRSDV